VLKNALDFLTFDEMEGKMIASSASPAAPWVRSTRSMDYAPWAVLHAWVLPQQVTIAEAYKVFDGEGRISDRDWSGAFAPWQRSGTLRHFTNAAVCASSCRYGNGPVNPAGLVRLQGAPRPYR